MTPQAIRKNDGFESTSQWGDFLESQMEKYWSEDVWYKKECPVLNWKTIHDIKPITYSARYSTINTELKFGRNLERFEYDAIVDLKSIFIHHRSS